MDNDRGIIYYATGKKYFDQAEESAASLKKNNNLPITVFTDVDHNSYVFDNITKINGSKYPFLDRIQYFRDPPYKKTLYLDTDTIIAGNIQPVFDILDRFDVVARIDPFRNTAGMSWGNDYADIDVPSAFPEYQCGVLGFNDNTKVNRTFKYWEERYSGVCETDLIDQPFFREAVYHNDVEIGSLPPEYNLLVNNLNILQEKGIVFHFNGGYSDNISIPVLGAETKKEVIKRINFHQRSRRAVYPGQLGGTKILLEPNPSALLKLYKSIVDNGIIFSIKKAINKIYEKS